MEWRGVIWHLANIARNKQLPGSSPTAASFEFIKEGHTLGNALRYIIMKKYVGGRLRDSV